MDKTQIVCFELTPTCNLGRKHATCPNLNPERWEGARTADRLTVGVAVETAVALYRKHHFQGYVAFHAYNEPLLASEDMFKVINSIRQLVPKSKFLLWTNGTLLPDDCSDFAVFEKAFVSVYEEAPPQNLDKLMAVTQVNLVVQQGQQWTVLDGRVTLEWKSNSLDPCMRPATELIFDAYANAHVCCYAWRGKHTMGNLHEDGLDRIVKTYQDVRRSVMGLKMTDAAPGYCKQCPLRTSNISAFDEGAKYRVEEWRKALVSVQAMGRKLGIVFVAHEQPGGDPKVVRRLYDHLRWNADKYFGASVFVVTDKHREFGAEGDIHEVIFPHDLLPFVDGKRRFSLTQTKNAGINAAKEAGCEVILCTDVDMVFPEAAWQTFREVGDDELYSPYYLLVDSFDERVEQTDTTEKRKRRLDRGCQGTICMTAANWDKCMYDPRLFGYGGDDGILVANAMRAGIRPVRNCDVWHVAHEKDAEQKNVPGIGRPDCWGRDSGYNFENLRANSLCAPYSEHVMGGVAEFGSMGPPVLQELPPASSGTVVLIQQIADMKQAPAAKQESRLRICLGCGNCQNRTCLIDMQAIDMKVYVDRWNCPERKW